MANQLWPHEDPLGKRIRLGSLNSKEPVVTVVGVVGRVKQYTLDTDSRIALYFPQAQYPVRAMNVVLRSSADPAVESASVTQVVHGLDPDLPVYSVRTMQARVAESLARRRFSMMLLVIFAAVSLVLAALGTYAVMAYLVNQGTPEIGIRVALGASRSSILGMIVKRGMLITLAGVAIGLIGAYLLSGLIRSLLFGILPTDPATYVVVSLFLVTVSFLATYIPARRAAHVDPVTSLRNE
jgi:ABC-type antimicrobial peptide transport system permease subunit